MNRLPQADSAPTVSVIMAARNASETIAVALASVSSQTLTSWELIVVDDASTDDTSSVVRRHAQSDPRIRLLNVTTQSGPGAARNLALEAARGHWVTVLDADDNYHHERLERLVRAAEARNADVYADNLRLECERRPEPYGPYAFEPDYLDKLGRITLEEFLDSDRPRNGRSSFGYIKPLMRRAFLEQHGLRYNPSLLVSEDSNLYLSILVMGIPIHCGGWGGYYYLRSEGSITRDEDNHLRNTGYALASNRALRQFARRLGDTQALAALRAHGRELSAVYSIDLLKHAIRRRSVLELIRWLPGGLLCAPWSLRFALSRLVAGRPDNPVGLPTLGRKSPTLTRDRRATDRPSEKSA